MRRANVKGRQILIESWTEQLHAWGEFYVIVGTAAAALTGLMFVVVSLGPQIIAAETATPASRRS
jgi:hypothetical protein